ncbi:MAG TPA: ABC transporter permease, partial [Roseateles sp.]|nr:ABC transporter permease [Roseateles sp.]
ALALLPAVDGLPLAAYLAMLSLLFGGLLSVPVLVRLLGRLLLAPRSAGRLLLRERAREHAGEAAQTLAGVLVALALSVAMLVMVTSFRGSLNDWLRQMLPADLYVRSGLRAEPGERAPLPPRFVEAVRASGLAERVEVQRSRRLVWEGRELALLARPLPDERRLPLAGPLGAAPAPGLTPLYVNEALRDQAGLRPGQRLDLPGLTPGFVRGIWRDYSRQSGAVLMRHADYRRAGGDATVTELYLWLSPGADLDAIQSGLRALAADPDDIELAAGGELLALSLRLFDRSFAVTYWLQAIALGLGLVGVAAALSAQVLARRREFGLLRHLGFTQGQILRLLLAETALYSAAGAMLGLLLGLGISAVLVFVVNPQSFHWSMDLALPWPRLAALLAATLAAALLTAWLSGRRVGRQDAVQAVKEDW